MGAIIREPAWEFTLQLLIMVTVGILFGILLHIGYQAREQ